LTRTSNRFCPAKLSIKTQQGETTEVLIETFIRKQLRLKAHTVTKVEETAECMIVHMDRLGGRLLRCGVCRRRCREVHSVRKEREWRDLAMRKLALKLCYRPRRRGVPALWRAGGGFSLGRAMGTSHQGAGQCRGRAGSGVELVGRGASVRAELEERSDDSEAGRAIWLEKPCAAAYTCDWNR